MNILPCRLDIQTCVTEQAGIVLVANIDPTGGDLKVGERTGVKFQDAYFLLTDEMGFLVNISKNFRKKFMIKEQFAIDDLRININDLVVGLDGSHTEEEIKNGIRCKIFKNFSST